jgi:RES domain-containing protein
MITHNFFGNHWFDHDFTEHWPSVTIQIARDIVAILVPEVVPDNGTLIEIWDWTKAIYKV